ncbi:MAG: hypothetical protein ACI4C3_09175 [Bacteroides sp.]
MMNMNNDLKQRHGCVTFWLWLVLIVNAGFTLQYLVMLVDADPQLPVLAVSLLALLGACNVYAALLLLRWNKTGFYLFICSSLAALVVNVTMLDLHPVQSATSLFGIAVWWGVLQIRRDGHSAWSQMECRGLI